VGKSVANEVGVGRVAVGTAEGVAEGVGRASVGASVGGDWLTPQPTSVSQLTQNASQPINRTAFQSDAVVALSQPGPRPILTLIMLFVSWRQEAMSLQKVVQSFFACLADHISPVYIARALTGFQG
jgi:hypothetical protein